MVKLRVVGEEDVGNEVGICPHNLDDLNAKKGDWVGIKFEHNGKIEETSAKIKRVQCEDDWETNLILVDEKKEKLKLPNEIQSSTPRNPSDYYVEVWKHTFPRDLKFWGAIVTAIITSLAAAFQGLSQYYKAVVNTALAINFGLAALIVIITGAILACIGTVLQRQ